MIRSFEQVPRPTGPIGNTLYARHSSACRSCSCR